MISIVTPSFQQLDWLRLAIASVSDQEGVAVEHIVQDAGTNGIKEFFDREIICRRNEDYHPRLFVEKDAGMYDAVNRGLAKVTGEVCAYLNCDEQYLAGALSKVARFFIANPTVDLVFGDIILVNQQGRPISYRRTIVPRLRHIQSSHLNTLSCAMFFRKRLLDRGFFFDPAWKDVGDGVWMENLLRSRVRMATIREPLSVFTFTGQNRSKDLVAQSERRERRRANVAGRNPIFRSAVILEHRLRKALAGAYKLRDVELSIYTLESPNCRQHFTGSNVGFSWPQ